MMEYGVLKPNRELLNPRFEGYKLASLEHHLQTLTLAISVCNVPLKDDHYNYAHLRSHGSQNLMALDSWNEKNNLIYFVDKDLQVVVLNYENDKFGCPVCIFKIPTPDKVVKDPVSASVVFPSKEFALVNDGSGKLYLINTGERGNATNQNWSDHKLLELTNIQDSFYFVYATKDAAKSIVHCILMTVEDEAGVSGKSIVTLHWLQIKEQSQISQAAVDSLVESVKRFKGTSVPVYCCISPNFSELIVAGEGRFQLLQENGLEVPVKEIATANGEAVNSEDLSAYKWSQTSEFVSVVFSLPESTKKEDITCDLTQSTVRVELKDGTKLLSGNLEKDIDLEASKWIFEKQSLEVVLLKKNVGTFWDTVVLGDKRGKHIIEGEEKERIREITERLDQYTSESLSSEKPSTYNSQQLEECDMSSDEDAKLVCIDKENGRLSLETSITGHQWLFNSSIEPDKPLYFCIRHDVDGILYKPVILDETHPTVSWKHMTTFNAFGFVTASKQDKKYTICGKDFGFIAIVDCMRNIYAYLHDETSQNKSKQYVLKLPHSEDIVGVQASKDTLFILSSSHVHAVRMI